MTELLNNIPEWLQIAFLVFCSVGCIVLWHFRKIVITVGVGAIAIYLAIKNSIAGED